MDLASDTSDKLCSADPQAQRAAVASRLCLLRSELQEAELQLAEYSVATRQLVHAAHDVGEAIAYLTQGGYVATLPDGSALERESLPPSVLKAAAGRLEAERPTEGGQPVYSLVAGERRPGSDGSAGGSGSSRSSG
jgi:hypothetical protein